MALRSWTILDVEARQCLPTLEVKPGDFAGEAGQRLRARKYTLRGGASEGVDVVEIDNGAVSLAVLPTRGMGIWRGRAGDVELGWRSPARGPVHPAWVNLAEPSGAGWMRGFDEWLCRCGLESNGAPEFDDQGRLAHPLHGRIANLPAHRVELSIDDATGEIALRGEVDEARLFGRKLRLTSTVRLRPGAAAFVVEDEVTNLSGETTDFQLLYHANFGVPLLQPGAKLVAPAIDVVPRDPHSATDVAGWDTYGVEQPGLAEYVHFFKLASGNDGRTGVLLRARDDRGVALRFDARQLPCFTMWKCQQPAADGYVTGLEPATNYPNRRSYEAQQGRTVPLEPGQSRSFAVECEVIATADRLQAVERELRGLAGGAQPRVHAAPQPGWSTFA